MKNTTTQKEAMMKDFTFGVEVEMNVLTRQDAAKATAQALGIRRKPKFQADGYMTWAVTDKDGREWKISRDTSIHGPDDEKCELITPILEPKDLPALLKILEALKAAGAVSNPRVGAGVHIHVGRKDGFTLKGILNLVNIMTAHEEQIGRAIRIDEERTNRYCKVIDPNFLALIDRKKPTTFRDLEDCWYKSDTANYNRQSHYNFSRYHMLNLHSFFNGHGTVEFRLFQFSNERGIDTDEMEAYILLCLGMCALAEAQKSASRKPQQEENEKYALRCWLLRLGFIGDEFKNARAALLKNCEGNAAWRKVC